MTISKFKLVPFVAVILKKDNKILLAKRAKKGWGNGEYALPGGSVDGNETIRAAAVREIKEELGVDINTSYWRLKIPFSVGGYCNGSLVFAAENAELP